ncbi:MAG: HD domain-containing protein [Pseudomonadota bacterium]
MKQTHASAMDAMSAIDESADGDVSVSDAARTVVMGDRFRAVMAESVARLEKDFDPAHDEGHLRRVIAAALHIGEREGADLDIVAAAGALHDVVNIPKNHPDRKRASAMAADASRAILMDAGYGARDTEAIATAVLEHSFSAGHAPSTLESAVVQDADRLDDLGAFGVFRTASVGTLFGARFYHLDDPVGEARAYDDARFTLDHFYTKLFKVEEKMNTQTARKIARKRAQFLKDFVAAMRDELALSAAMTTEWAR